MLSRMPFQKGKPKTGGRKSGSGNKLKAEVEAILTSLKCDPIAGLARIAKATEKKSPQTSAFCYAKLANKVHPDKKATDHDHRIVDKDGDDTALRLVVEYIDKPSPSADPQA